MTKKIKKYKLENIKNILCLTKNNIESIFNIILTSFKKLKILIQHAFINKNDSQYREDTLESYILPIIHVCFAVIVCSTLIFVIWGSVAPLDSAIIAQGSVAPSQKSKAIQHFEGGVIEKILVNDGSNVKAGDPLIILNSSAPLGDMLSRLSLLRAYSAIEARLIAEVSNKEEIDFGAIKYIKNSDAEFQLIMKNQTNIFNARREEFKGNLKSLSQEINRLEQKLNGQKHRLKSMEHRLKMEREVLNDISGLFDKQIASKHTLMKSQQSYQDALAGVSEIKAEISATEQEIAKTITATATYKHKYYSEIGHEYENNHARLLDIEQKYKQSLDVLNRTVIKAPISGVVTGLKHYTIGGVILHGEKIMYIVPKDDKLIIEAQIMPQDINNLKVGLETKIQLTPYKQRLVPRIPGKVVYVSADRISNERPSAYSPQEFYLVKIEIDQEALKKLKADIKLSAGMPAVVFIVRGSRTFLQYLISPIRDSFYRAFKEQ